MAVDRWQSLGEVDRDEYEHRPECECSNRDGDQGRREGDYKRSCEILQQVEELIVAMNEGEVRLRSKLNMNEVLYRIDDVN